MLESGKCRSFTSIPYQFCNHLSVLFVLFMEFLLLPAKMLVVAMMVRSTPVLFVLSTYLCFVNLLSLLPSKPLLCQCLLLLDAIKIIETILVPCKPAAVSWWQPCILFLMHRLCIFANKLWCSLVHGVQIPRPLPHTDQHLLKLKGSALYTGCFFNWYPPKKLKYGKPRLGESTLT